MKPIYTRQHYEEVASFLRDTTRHRPQVAIVLGSGFSAVVDSLGQADILPYSEIPHFPHSSVEGHAGRLAFGTLSGQSVVIMQGRTHFYEGFDLEQITLPIRVLRVFGVDTLILTNAAGGLNRDFQVGDLMLIEDQINLVGMIGHNPLMGPNDDSIGPRFPDMSALYDRALRELAMRVAEDRNLPLRRGIYIGLSGPAYETPAEIRFLRLIGGDATGMSTTNEAVTARHCGMRVLGFSGISNIAIDTIDSPDETTHEEVLAASHMFVPRITALVEGILARWHEVA